MRFTAEGLALWYGTADAPAPLGEIVPRHEASLVVGVHPANPTNVVGARFRVDGGIVQQTAGRELRTDYGRNNQYFAITFPPFPGGKVVEYCPFLGQGGRQLPAVADADRFPSQFTLAPDSGRSGRGTPSAARSMQRFTPEFEFLTAITVRVDEPQYIGETPEGVRINFYAREGTATGPRLGGKVLPGSNDHMIVRRDGIGLIRVRAAIAGNDGAMFEIEEVGTIDFGPDGHERALAKRLPVQSSLVVHPRILTGHPKYAWLNRAGCLGVGRTRLDAGEVDYDVFTITSSFDGRAP